MANIPDDDRETIFQRSQELSAQYPAVNITDIMEMARGAYSVMGDAGRAAGVLKRMVQALVVAQSTQNPDAATQQIINLIRGLDILGVNSSGPEGVDRVNKIIDAAVKASQADPDFRPGDYLQFARTAKVAGLAVSDEFMTRVPAYVQDMGAGTSGNSLAMGFKSFLLEAVGSAGGKKYLQARNALGIRKHGKLVEAELYGRAPDAWALKVLKPALEKHGVDMSNHTAVAAAIGKLSGNTTATGFLTHIIEQSDQISRWLSMMDKAMGADAADEVRNNDPIVAWKGVQESLRNLSASIGETVMPVIVPGLNSLANTINAFAAAVHDQDPRIMTGAGIAAAGVAGYGAYKTVSGIWALTTAGTSLQTAAVMLQEAALAQSGGKIGAAGQTAAGAAAGGGLMAWLTKGIRAGVPMGIWSLLTESLADTPGDTFEKQVENQRKAREGLQKMLGQEGDQPFSWKRFFLGAAAEPGFSFHEAMKMDLGGEMRTPHKRSDSPFGEMLSGMVVQQSQTVAPEVNQSTTAPTPELHEPPLTKGDVAPMSDGAVPGDLRVTPTLDASGAVAAADQAGSQIQRSLSVTGKPTIDTSGLEHALSLVRQIQGALLGMPSATARASSRINSEMRRAYSDYGVVP
jgi:hypothetical protein